MTVFIEFVNTLYTFLIRFIHTEIFNSNYKNVQKISICNQMVTSEIREQFHARFVQILIISRTFRRGKLLGFGQNVSEIIP